MPGIAQEEYKGTKVVEEEIKVEESEEEDDDISEENGLDEKDNQQLTLANTTFDLLETPELAIEDRITNREEMDSLGLLSHITCIICQDVILPKSKIPVFCIICNNAVYCRSCIMRW